MMMTASAFASETTKVNAGIYCKVSIDNEIVFEGLKELDHEEGEPEGSGQALVVESGNIEVYVVNYPIFIVINYVENGIVWLAENSFETAMTDLMLKRNDRVARLNTSIFGQKIEARCTDN